MHYSFETSHFLDCAEVRERNINEIEGYELAVWLTGELKKRGISFTEIWAEDHGWDFDIKHDDISYSCSCSINRDDETGDGHVTILKGRAKIPTDNPVISAIAEILKSSEKIDNLDLDP